MSKQFQVVIAFLILCTGCSTKAKSDTIDYLIYGVYAGECFGHCSTMYKVTKSKLFIDTTDSYFKGTRFVWKRLNFDKETLNEKGFATAQEAITQLPELLLSSNDREFGYPDSHDQGGIFIQFKVDTNLKTFWIDTELDQIPFELRDYAKLIMRLSSFKSL
jgi:hypothetical protein